MRGADKIAPEDEKQRDDEYRVADLPASSERAAIATTMRTQFGSSQHRYAVYTLTSATPIVRLSANTSSSISGRCTITG